jgi:hypothetical protein
MRYHKAFLLAVILCIHVGSSEGQTAPLAQSIAPESSLPTTLGGYRLMTPLSSVDADTQVSSYEDGVVHLTIVIKALRHVRPDIELSTKAALASTLQWYTDNVIAARNRGQFDVLAPAYSTLDSVVDLGVVYPGRTIAIAAKKGDRLSILFFFEYIVRNHLVYVTTAVPTAQVAMSHIGIFAHAFVRRYARRSL